ncbi:cytochrome c biogenesis protein ResB [Prochlorococcus sp. MIT 1223]|uniref:cytochrome c biogenesis protein ResB n=1 Tax=Prochlorococcus sp. MIT 1223 TaxID=3096217 RepID=UPI002A7575D1|nr:cytochrome c biogenesis protein ResB [Prochlorococcus sp. MIT 1223]
MFNIERILLKLSNLKTAIILLIVIAIASAIGTAIPQGESSQSYIEIYGEHPLLGIVNGNLLLFFQFDHIYSSYWFLILLIWLGLALIACSWRRQWPMLKSALRWVDYKSSKQVSKLAVSQTIPSIGSTNNLDKLSKILKEEGWDVNQKDNRIAARKGVIGRVGPLLVHLGLILLMIGSIFGVLNGQKVERFLAPDRSLDLITSNGDNQLSVKLKEFQIDRDPVGRPSQFHSKIEIKDIINQAIFLKEVSVNHPIRFKGITIYQADWSLAAITIQIENSPKIQLPLKTIPELGEEVWGVVIPTNTEGENPILMTIDNELGPIKVFDEQGTYLESLNIDGIPKNILGASIKATNVIPSSGLLLKRDPGVPIVYSGFAVTMIGGLLSLIATRQIWAVIGKEQNNIYIGGLCNRNLSGFANKDMPSIIDRVLNNN